MLVPSSKVSSEHSHAYSFTYYLGLLLRCNDSTELRSYNRDHID